MVAKTGKGGGPSALQPLSNQKLRRLIEKCVKSPLSYEVARKKRNNTKNAQASLFRRC